MDLPKLVFLVPTGLVEKTTFRRFGDFRASISIITIVSVGNILRREIPEQSLCCYRWGFTITMET